jgi:hypothetical protein
MKALGYPAIIIDFAHKSLKTPMALINYLTISANGKLLATIKSG